MKALVIWKAVMSRNDWFRSITDAGFKHNDFSESRSTLDINRFRANACSHPLLLTDLL